ncbi:MAG: Crp/Fnr family transcriptional regulator [Pedobacter sp.]
MNEREAIKSCPLFVGVTDSDLDDLTRIARQQIYAKDQMVFSEGEVATGFFIPLEGKVKIYKLSPEGRERVLRIAHPGRTFAEAAIFDVGVFPAYAQAIEPTVLLFFPKQAVLDLLHCNAQLAINMVGGLSRILREMMDHMESLTFKDVPSRLARYLLDLSDMKQRHVHLPVSKAQLAANLNTAGETLSRTLRKMSDDNLITVRGRTIEILNFQGLLDLAERYKE